MDPHSYPMQAIRCNEVIRRNQRSQVCWWFSSRPSAQSNPYPSPINPLPLVFLLRTSIPDPDHPAPPTHPSWFGFSPRHQDAPSASGSELPSLAWQEEWVDRLVEEWAPDEESLLQEARRQQEARRPLQEQEDEETALVQPLSASTNHRPQPPRHKQHQQPPTAPRRHASPCVCIDEHGREKDGEWLCLPSSQAQRQSAPILLLLTDSVLQRRNRRAVLMQSADDDEDCDGDGDVASTSTLPSTPFRFNVGAAAFTPRRPQVRT